MVYVYSKDSYVLMGIRSFVDTSFDSEKDFHLIDMAEFPDDLSLYSLLRRDGVIILLAPEKCNLSLLAYACKGFLNRIYVLSRKAPLSQFLLSLQGKGIHLSEICPSLTPNEYLALKAFLQVKNIDSCSGKKFPYPPHMECKKASYYRQRLSFKLGFRSSQAFYVGLAMLQPFIG